MECIIDMGICVKQVAAVVLFQRQGRTGSWVWRKGGSNEGQQLAYLFPWSVQLVCSQEMRTGVTGQDNGMS